MIVLDDVLDPDTHDVRTWAAWSDVLPHVLMACDHAELLDVEPEVCGWLLDRASVYLRHQAQAQEAVALSRRAVERTERAHHRRHVALAIPLVNLGLALADLSERNETETAFERAIEIEADALGEHEEAAATLGVVSPFNLM